MQQLDILLVIVMEHGMDDIGYIFEKLIADKEDAGQLE